MYRQPARLLAIFSPAPGDLTVENDSEHDQFAAEALVTYLVAYADRADRRIAYTRVHSTVLTAPSLTPSEGALILTVRRVWPLAIP